MKMAGEATCSLQEGEREEDSDLQLLTLHSHIHSKLTLKLKILSKTWGGAGGPGALRALILHDSP